MSGDDDKVFQKQPSPIDAETSFRRGRAKKFLGIGSVSDAPDIKERGLRKLVDKLFFANVVSFLIFLALCFQYQNLPTLGTVTANR